jgi:hypothetical protein
VCVQRKNNEEEHGTQTREVGEKREGSKMEIKMFRVGDTNLTVLSMFVSLPTVSGYLH